MNGVELRCKALRASSHHRPPSRHLLLYERLAPTELVVFSDAPPLSLSPPLARALSERFAKKVEIFRFIIALSPSLSHSVTKLSRLATNCTPPTESSRSSGESAVCREDNVQ